jgi:O-antigen ligase
VQNLPRYWNRFIDLAGVTGIIITTALLPFDRFPYLHHVPFSLGFISLILLLAASGWQLLQAWRAGHHDWLRRYLIVGALLALPVLAYLASVLYAIDPAYSLGATKLLAAVALRAFCFFVLITARPQLWQVFKKTIYIVTALVVAFAFFQFFADVFNVSTKYTDLRFCCTSQNSTYVFPRVHSVSIEPLYFANFLLIPIWLISFDFWRAAKARRNRWLLALLFGCAVVTFIIIARGALLALMLSGAIFLWGLKGQKLRQFLWLMAKLWGAAFIVAMILITAAGWASQYIQKHAIHGNNSGVGNVAIFGGHALDLADESAQTRYKLWPKSLTYIKERPLIGVGAYNSRIRLNLEKFNAGRAPTTLQPFNNDLIGLAVDLGLMGLLAFAPLLCALFWALRRLFRAGLNRPLAPMAMVMIGMLVQSNFFHSILLTRLWVVVGLLLAAVYVELPKKASAK